MSARRLAASLAFLFAALRPLAAQCPDGSPPPCARAAATLDDRKWIVVPFNNITRAQDAEWLGAASVNLLYLSLSRWRDISVVDDERVADLLRGRSGAALGLRDALLLARRAGAGQVVMGDLMKAGASLTVVAKVYEVRSGKRLREVTVQVPAPDSVFVAYRRLAAGLLTVSEQGSAAGPGTTSLSAYRDFVCGLREMHAWSLDSAAACFRRAIATDSTFALAHYELARTLGWNSADSTTTGHAATAARLSADLPERERTLIMAYLDFLTGRFEPARTAYRRLVSRDSLDAEAWYNLGETEFHDNTIQEGHPRAFGGSWNAARAYFQRTLALDPSYHLAFGHLLDIYSISQRRGCLQLLAGRYSCQHANYTAQPRLDGDTLVMIPLPDSLAADSFFAQRRESIGSGEEAWGLRAARSDAERWVRAAPDEVEAHAGLGEALLRLGDVGGAAREFASVRGPSTRRRSASALMRLRFDLAIKRDSFSLASALADSLAATPVPAHGDASAAMFSTLGRLQEWEARLPRSWEPGIREYYAATVRVLAGIIPLGLDSAEAHFLRGAGDLRTANDSLYALWYSTIYAVRFRQRHGMVADTTAKSNLFMKIPSALILGDTGKAHRWAVQLDTSMGHVYRQEEMALVLLELSETNTELGDTTKARQQLYRFETEIFPGADLHQFGYWQPEGAMWGRAFLLQGDLAAAQHDRETMIRAYRRVVGLWSTGDSEVQPAVARARAALAAVESSP